PAGPRHRTPDGKASCAGAPEGPVTINRTLAFLTSIAGGRGLYERPALRKLLDAFPAASKVAAASLAVIATVVSISERLPPAAAARTADAAPFSSGNSPITSQSWRPNVKYQPISLPPTLLNKLATASSRFSGLANMPLTASVVNLPREM